MAILDNIVAYWKQDESSGNATDATGNGYTLTNTGTVTYAAGRVNNGADYGSTNTTKSLSSTSALGIAGGAVTLSCWVKLAASPSSGNQYSLMNIVNMDGSPYVAYDIFYKNDSGTYNLYFRRWRVNQVNQWVIYEVTLTEGVWYHIVLTYDATKIVGYLNGNNVGEENASGNGSTGGISTQTNLGAIAASNYTCGMTDEAGVWSRALSSTEVTTIYTNIQYPFTSPPTPISPFPSFRQI